MAFETIKFLVDSCKMQIFVKKMSMPNPVKTILAWFVFIWGIAPYYSLECLLPSFACINIRVFLFSDYQIVREY